jgi:hypothetical protein
MESGYSVVRESLSRSFWQDLPRPSRALRERISPSYCAMTPGNPGGGWDSSTAASRSAIEPQLRSSMPSLYPLQSGAHIHRARWVAGLTAWTDSPARGSPDQLSLPHQRIKWGAITKICVGRPVTIAAEEIAAPRIALSSASGLSAVRFPEPGAKAISGKASKRFYDWMYSPGNSDPPVTCIRTGARAMGGGGLERKP